MPDDGPLMLKCSAVQLPDIAVRCCAVQDRMLPGINSALLLTAMLLPPRPAACRHSASNRSSGAAGPREPPAAVQRAGAPHVRVDLCLLAQSSA